MIEVRIGKNRYPMVATASFSSDGNNPSTDFLIVFLVGKEFWGLSVRERKVAPIKFDLKQGKSTWGGRTIKFL